MLTYEQFEKLYGGTQDDHIAYLDNGISEANAKLKQYPGLTLTNWDMNQHDYSRKDWLVG